VLTEDNLNILFQIGHDLLIPLKINGYAVTGGEQKQKKHRFLQMVRHRKLQMRA